MSQTDTVGSGAAEAPARVAIVDDDPSFVRLMARLVARGGHEPVTYPSAAEMLADLDGADFDVVLLDRWLPEADGLDVLDALRAERPYLPVVMLTADAEIEAVVSAVRRGAYDYVAKPAARLRLDQVLAEAIQHSRLGARLRRQGSVDESHAYRAIIGRSPPMRRLFAQIERVAAPDTTLLVAGESGTGKELVARAVHAQSPRSDQPFIALNCAAVPGHLQESEFFGHERGAFTGAARRRLGRFEQADGGTLFLDEVGELSLDLQAKLLRVLENRAFFRVGGVDEVRVDVRLLAATHRDLRTEVEAGRFRQDLYFRLAVIELDVPPLRIRGDDILLLTRTFLADLARRHQRRPPRLAPEVIERIEQYGWPGNVRELRNAMERVVVLAGDDVTIEDLPARMRPALPQQAQALAPPAAPTDPFAGLTMAQIERQAIAAALERHKGNAKAAAAALDMPRTTFYRRLSQYGLRGLGRVSPGRGSDHQSGVQ